MRNNSISNILIEDQVLAHMSQDELLATVRSLSAAYEKSTTLLGQAQVENDYQSKLLLERTEQWDEMYELLRLRQFEVEVYHNVIDCQLLFKDNASIVMSKLHSKIMAQYYAAKEASMDVNMDGLPQDWND